MHQQELSQLSQQFEAHMLSQLPQPPQQPQPRLEQHLWVVDGGVSQRAPVHGPGYVTEISPEVPR
jgi:hypothetical protein